MENQYNAIKVQNQSLEKYISGTKDYFSLENKLFNYKSDKLPILEYTKYGMIILYGIVFIVLLIVLFIKANNLSIYSKIGFIVLFAIYPFFIYPAENALYQIYYYVYAILYGESYTKIMSRKGLQNPKNFKDITSLSSIVNNAGSVLKKYTSDLENLIKDLPDVLQTTFTDLLNLIQQIPDIAKTILLKLQEDMISKILQFQSQISDITTVNDILLATVNFYNEINNTIQDFLTNINDLKLPDDVMLIINDTINTVLTKLDVTIYLKELDAIINVLPTELQKLSEIGTDDINKLLQDITNEYQKFITVISNMSDLTQIQNEITNFMNIINNLIITCWNNIQNLQDQVSTINDIFNNLIYEINITFYLEQLLYITTDFYTTLQNIPQKLLEQIPDVNTEIYKLQQYIQIAYQTFISKISNISDMEIKRLIPIGFVVLSYYINYKIHEFWNEIIKANLSNEDFTTIYNEILSIQTKLNVIIYSDQLYPFITDFFSNITTKLSNIPDSAKTELYKFQNDVLIIYNNFKTNVSLLTDLQTIQNEIVNFFNGINTRIQTFWNYIISLKLQNIDIVSIYDEIINLLSNISITSYLQQFEYTINRLPTTFQNILQEIPEINTELSKLQTNIVTKYDEFKKTIYDLTDIQKIQNEIINIGNTINKQILDFWNNIKNQTTLTYNKISTIFSMMVFSSSLRIAMMQFIVKYYYSNYYKALQDISKQITDTTVMTKFYSLQQNIDIIYRDSVSKFSSISIIYSLTDLQTIQNEIVTFGNDINEKIKTFWNDINKLNLNGVNLLYIYDTIKDFLFKINIMINLQQLETIINTIPYTLNDITVNFPNMVIVFQYDIVKEYNDFKNKIYIAISSANDISNDIVSSISSFSTSIRSISINVNSNIKGFWNDIIKNLQNIDTSKIDISQIDITKIINEINNLQLKINMNTYLQKIQNSVNVYFNFDTTVSNTNLQTLQQTFIIQYQDIVTKYQNAISQISSATTATVNDIQTAQNAIINFGNEINKSLNEYWSQVLQLELPYNDILTINGDIINFLSEINVTLYLQQIQVITMAYSTTVQDTLQQIYNKNGNTSILTLQQNIESTYQDFMEKLSNSKTITDIQTGFDGYYTSVNSWLTSSANDISDVVNNDISDVLKNYDYNFKMITYLQQLQSIIMSLPTNLQNIIPNIPDDNVKSTFLTLQQNIVNTYQTSISNFIDGINIPSSDSNTNKYTYIFSGLDSTFFTKLGTDINNIIDKIPSKDSVSNGASNGANQYITNVYEIVNQFKSDFDNKINSFFSSLQL
jgi:hypothetical protein